MLFLSNTAHTAKFAPKFQKDRKIKNSVPRRLGRGMKRAGHGQDSRHPKYTFFTLGSWRLKNQVLGAACLPYVFPFKNGSYGKVCFKISKRQENRRRASESRIIGKLASGQGGSDTHCLHRGWPARQTVVPDMWLFSLHRLFA